MALESFVCVCVNSIKGELLLKVFILVFDKENGSKGVFVNILLAQNVLKKGDFALRFDGKAAPALI